MRSLVILSLILDLLFMLRLSVAVPSASLSDLLNQDGQCSEYVRNGLCPNSSLEYVFYANSSTQSTLNSLLDTAGVYINNLIASEPEECRQALTDYFCDTLFPPCTNGTENAMALCPTCLSSMCQMAYLTVRTSLNSTDNAPGDPLLQELVQGFVDQCIINNTACPTQGSPGAADDPFLTGASRTLVVLVGITAAVLIIVVIVLEGVCCYCCCVPTTMKMADFEKGDFLVKSAVDYVYGQGTIGDRRMSRAAMIKHAFFRRFTNLRRTRFQSKEQNHSDLPEPYKSILTYKKHLVIEHRKISLERCLSEGEVGQLYAGTLLELAGGNSIFSRTVVVRTIDINHNESVCIQMVEEVARIADLMHPHILNPIGVAIAVEKPLYILYPFLENRDIKSYLSMPESHPKNNFIPRISFIFQVSLGMEFLTSRGVIHRNLCAKNCLLDSSLTVKIGGFGTPESYTAASPYSLPADQEDKWKWMALELLHYLEQVDVTCFSEYTDVWAFGITAWEIYTLLDPYEGRYLTDIIPQLEKGNRLSKPANCAESFYELILSCWDANPSKRPSFKTISMNIHQEMAAVFQGEHYSSSDSGIDETGNNNDKGRSKDSSVEFSKFNADTQPEAIIEPVHSPRIETYRNLSPTHELQDSNDDCYASPSAWTDEEPYEEYVMSPESIGGVRGQLQVKYVRPSVLSTQAEVNEHLMSPYENLSTSSLKSTN